MASLRDKVTEVAARIGANPEDLWQVIQYESQGNPKAIGPKPKSGKPGVGILQFMESTARNLGTTQEDLLKMTAEQQLPYVEKYFQDIKRRHKLDKFNLRQLYASVMAGTPHAGLDYGDGYTTVGKVVKTIEGRKKAEGAGDKPVVEDVLSKLYGEKKEETPVFGHGPLKSEGLKAKAKEIQHKQDSMPAVSPERPWHERLKFGEDNIVETTVQQARDMGMNVGGKGEEEKEDPYAADRAAWEFMYPDKPMPEGWTVEGELRKSIAEKEAALATPPPSRPREWSDKYRQTPGWADKYRQKP